MAAALPLPGSALDSPDVPALRAAAAARMERGALGYYASGAGDEVTLRDNAAAFSRVAIAAPAGAQPPAPPAPPPDTTTALLGRAVSWPLGLAPCAFHALAHPEGERATARATAGAGIGACWSTFGTTWVYDVATEADAAHDAAVAAGRARPGTPRPPRWFQLYWLKDFALTAGLVAHALAAGCTALVLTVDRPVLGKREIDRRSKFDLPPGMLAPNVLRALRPPLVARGDGTFAPPDGAPTDSGDDAFAGSFYLTAQVEDSLTWADLARLRALLPPRSPPPSGADAATTAPAGAGTALIVKGVLTYEDGYAAVAAGCDAVWVSNHGARQLDGVAAALDALPEVVAGVRAAEADATRRGGAPGPRRARVEVYVDGGVSCGEDVFKAVALGADAAFLARPVLWALAAGGAPAVAALLSRMRAQFEAAMAATGCARVADIGLHCLVEAEGAAPAGWGDGGAGEW